MKFEEAIALLRQGKFVRRERWKLLKHLEIFEDDVYLVSSESSSRKSARDVIFSLEDVEADDWSVIE